MGEIGRHANPFRDELQAALSRDGQLRLSIPVTAEFFWRSGYDNRLHSLGHSKLPAGEPVFDLERDARGTWLTLESGDDVLVTDFDESWLITEATWQAEFAA